MTAHSRFEWYAFEIFQKWKAVMTLSVLSGLSYPYNNIYHLNWRVNNESKRQSEKYRCRLRECVMFLFEKFKEITFCLTTSEKRNPFYQLMEIRTFFCRFSRTMMLQLRSCLQKKERDLFSRINFTSSGNSVFFRLRFSNRNPYQTRIHRNISYSLIFVV